MSRIRTIKPEFWTNARVVECSTNARLLFVGLWNFCDDCGNHPASPKTVKGSVFPCDNFTTDDIRRMLDELSSNGLIEFYANENKQYFNVIGWEHQKIDRKQRPRYPSKFDENSTRTRRELDDNSLLYQHTTIIESSLCSDSSAIASKKIKSQKPSALEILKTALSEKTAQDLIDHRKAKRAPLTPRAAEGLVAAFRDHGDPERAAEAMIVNGWQGFKPEWMANNARASPNGHQGPITAFNRPSMRDHIRKADQEAREAKQKLLDLEARERDQKNDP